MITTPEKISAFTQELSYPNLHLFIGKTIDDENVIMYLEQLRKNNPHNIYRFDESGMNSIIRKRGDYKMNRCNFHYDNETRKIKMIYWK